MHCLSLVLTEIPRGLWVCFQCINAGVNYETVKTARQLQLDKYERSADGSGATQPAVTQSSKLRPKPPTASRPSERLTQRGVEPLTRRGLGRPRKQPLQGTVAAIAGFDWTSHEGVSDAV